MGNFDWHEDENLPWGDPPRQKQTRKNRRWPRWLLFALLVLAGLGVGGTAVYRQLTSRVDEVSFEVESALRRSHTLVYQAAQEQDRELFVTLLSGRDDRWATAQERMVDAGILFGRESFGLALLPGDVDVAVVDIQISPDLTTAVLTTTHDYALDIGNGLSQTVALYQTAIYRRGTDRWLFSPPDADFWGEIVRTQGEILLMSYPARDTAVARRLAADIEAGVTDMCNRLADIACPKNLSLRIDLSPDPAILYETNRLPVGFTVSNMPVRAFRWYNFAARSQGTAPVITLPAPTLFGLPQDEAGYQALYRGYATRVLSKLIVDLVGWQCCASDVLFQATLDMEMAQMGLRPWPILAENYTAVLGMSVEEVYQKGMVDGQMVYVHMLVAFLAQELGVSPVMVQRKLAETPNIAWDVWLNEFQGVELEDALALDRRWLAFVYSRSLPDQTPPSVPLPEQHVQLVCRSVGAETASLYRYDPLTRGMVGEQGLNRSTVVLHPLPDRSGVIVAEQNFQLNATAFTLLVQDETQTPLGYGATGAAAPTPLLASADGRYLLFYQAGTSAQPYSFLDWPGCQTRGQCDLQPLLGAAVWSPNGQRMVLQGSGSRDGSWHMLFLADGNGRHTQYIAVGRAAAWLDEDTAVFVHEEGGVMAVDAETLVLTPLFAPADLASKLEAERSSRATMQITFVAAHPHNSQLLLAGAEDGFSSYVFQFDRAEGVITPLFPQEFIAGPLPADKQFSPDGRWLVQLVVAREGTGWELVLTHWQTAESQTYAIGTLNPPYLGSLVDWSADGQWLALAADGYLRLIAPNHEYVHWFLPKHLSCNQAVWLNK